MRATAPRHLGAMNDILRLVCIGALFYSLLVLWQRWEEWPPNNPGARAVPQQDGSQEFASDGLAEPDPNDDDAPPVATQQLSAGDFAPASSIAEPEDGGLIEVDAGAMKAGISRNGGAIVSLLLPKHPNPSGGDFALFESFGRRHGEQSGLIGAAGLPDHRATFTIVNPDAPRNFEEAGENANSLTVMLAAESGGVRLLKRYVFARDSYVVRLEMEAENRGNAPVSPKGYFQLFHNGAIAQQEGSSFLPTFFGAAVFTDERKFEKIAFEDIGRDDYPRKSGDGWIGFIQRYFAAVWLPPDGLDREYFMRPPGASGSTRIGVIAPFGRIAPGESGTISMRLFAGAQEQDVLNALNENGDAPGIHLVVDYGWLTVVAVPLFKLLAFIQQYIGNWGAAIIVLTFLIKLVFYPLSSISYRSIARMKELAPRVKQLQEAHRDDKQRMQQALMALYREKKVNPFGGCLPVLLQIPVFIALYWVILGSVELRLAPFYLWIDDLSAADPWFILPLAMGAAMFLQTRMSPTPPDPTQALIIKIMPVFFTVFSLFFPAGLVLYWLVNTLLSIAQQWHISRSIARASSKGAG